MTTLDAANLLLSETERAMEQPEPVDEVKLRLALDDPDYDRRTDQSPDDAADEFDRRQPREREVESWEVDDYTEERDDS